MEQEIKILFNWNIAKIEPITADIRELLENEAKDRIFSMMKEGYTSGELSTQINNDEVNGYWEINTTNLL